MRTKERVGPCDCGPGIVCGVCKPVPNLGKPGKRVKSKTKIHKIERPKEKKLPKQKPPKEKHCRKLGYETFTERWCHAESKIIKFSVGGGIMGSRIPDHLTAWLSVEADAELSQPLPNNATQKRLKEHAAEWRRLIDLSH